LPATKLNLPGIDDEISNIVTKFRESAEECDLLLLVAERELETLIRVSRSLAHINRQAAHGRDLATDERCRDGSAPREEEIIVAKGSTRRLSIVPR